MFQTAQGSKAAMATAALLWQMLVCYSAFAKDPTPPAETLIREGLELRRLGRDADALPKFEAAYKSSRSPRAAAQWGLCLQAVSRWSDAEPLLTEAISAPHDIWVRKNREVIKQSLETGKSHIGRLEVVGEPSGAAVKVGGRMVGLLPLPSPIVVNEGSIDIEVSAQGFARTLRTVTVSGASYQNIVINLQKQPNEDGAQIPPVRVRATESNMLSTQPVLDEEQPSNKSSRWLWVGGAGLAIVAGVVLGVLAFSSESDPSPGQVRNVP